MALQSTTELFSEPAVGLCASLMALAIVRWRDDWQWSPGVLGLASAAVIQFRSDSLLTVWPAILALPLFVPLHTLLRRRSLLWVGLPVAASLSFLMWYNNLRFGSLLVAGYHGQGFHTPLDLGLKGLLLSPGRGLFVYSPLALPGVVGLVYMYVRRQAFAVLGALLILPRLILFAKWGAWAGGLCWGPRFLMPSLPVLIVGAFYLLQMGSKPRAAVKAARLVLAMTAILSVPVNLLSVRVPYEQWHGTLVSTQQRAHYLGDSALIDSGRRPADVWPSELFTVNASDLRGDMLLLRAGTAEMAPAWWRQGLPAVGWLLVVAFAGGSVLAVALACARDLAPRGGAAVTRARSGVRTECGPGRSTVAVASASAPD